MISTVLRPLSEADAAPRALAALTMPEAEYVGRRERPRSALPAAGGTPRSTVGPSGDRIASSPRPVVRRLARPTPPAEPVERPLAEREVSRRLRLAARATRLGGRRIDAPALSTAPGVAIALPSRATPSALTPYLSVRPAREGPEALRLAARPARRRAVAVREGPATPAKRPGAGAGARLAAAGVGGLYREPRATDRAGHGHSRDLAGPVANPRAIPPAAPRRELPSALRARPALPGFPASRVPAFSALGGAAVRLVLVPVEGVGRLRLVAPDAALHRAPFFVLHVGHSSWMLDGSLAPSFASARLWSMWKPGGDASTGPRRSPQQAQRPRCSRCRRRTSLGRMKPGRPRR